MSSRRQFLQTLPAAAALAPPARRPNVLVLMSDEHNPFFSQPYGHPFVSTPNMQRLARLGTVFSNAYCPSPLCLPSRSSFLSGRRVFDLQTYGNCNLFTSDTPSYGRVLASQGVHSVHIGKTDVYNQAATLGFSEMILPADRNPPGDTYVSRNPLAVQADSEGRAGGFGVKPNPFQGDNQKVAAALQWLSETAPKLNTPWTLSLNLLKPHFPHNVTQDLWDQYAAHADLPPQGREAEPANHPYAQDLRRFFGTDVFNGDKVRNLRRGYYGCITYIDRQLGVILDALEKSGQLSNTVVAYTSDHGEMLGKYGLWWKRSLYEDSARIPMIVAGPGFQPGRRVDTPVDLHDLQASLFEATGAARPKHWCGTPLQRIPSNDPQRVVFSEFQGGGTRASAFLIRQGRWKLIYNCAAPHQLFDLESSDGELTNLASKHPGIVRKLEKELRRICSPEHENQRAEDYIQRLLKALPQKG
ncbi:MAG: sulfatase-like hydrolase/transferase [Acidobacteria bacterium]|nr:sulfatase-like hydrolase/transferase [Acidobacteriota bacterium]